MPNGIFFRHTNSILLMQNLFLDTEGVTYNE